MPTQTDFSLEEGVCVCVHVCRYMYSYILKVRVALLISTECGILSLILGHLVSP